jgi:NhaA family Na+:H+ antiporter
MKNFRFLSMFKTYVNSSVLLIVATVLALFIANSPASEAYSQFWNQPVSLSIGGFNLFSHGGETMTLMALINDFFMAIFFLSVGLEIKREFWLANYLLLKMRCYLLSVLWEV